MRDPEEGAGGLQRPFVPGQPPAPQSLPRDSGFAPPFIPGEEPPEVITDQVAGLSPLAAELPSITEFLYEEQPAEAEPVQAETAEPPPEYPTPAAHQTPERGSVRPLPGFTPEAGVQMPDYSEPPPQAGWGAPPTAPPAQAGWGAPPPAPAPRPTPAHPTARPADSWATGEWQRYDWRSASSLAPEERARAAQAWADLDWEPEARQRVRERNETIAAALETIARRVRSGDLLVHGHPGMTEEAAAAAALAALLARRP